MEKDKLIIWGATGQAIVLEELISSSQIAIECFFENNQTIKAPFSQIPIHYGVDGFKNWLSNTPNFCDYYFAVAIGGEHGIIRRSIGDMLEKEGLKPYHAIHKTSFISYNATIGKGCHVLAQTSICAKAIIGDYCIINTSASIDHECVIGHGTHIGPGAKLAGCISIGENVFIGTNATILPRIEIGDNTIVGAGAVVINNLPSNCVAVGNPAKIIKYKS